MSPSVALRIGKSLQNADHWPYRHYTSALARIGLYVGVEFTK